MKCPCCQQELPVNGRIRFDDANATLIHKGIAVRLSPLEVRIVSAIRRCALPMAQLIDSVYGHDPDGGPENPRECVAVSIVRLNRRLLTAGLRIGADKSRYSNPLYSIHVA